MLTSIASFLTSVASLAGFLLTAGLARRKERRERQQSALDLETKRLELEKLRIDLERQKHESSSTPSKPNDVT
jgi:hypothetical protein